MIPPDQHDAARAKLQELVHDQARALLPAVRALDVQITARLRAARAVVDDAGNSIMEQIARRMPGRA